MDDFYDAIDRFKWVVLLISPVVLILASGGGYWLSRRALAPVDRITQAAQDINSHNLAKRLDVPQSGDELQRLSQTLNNMLERLEASFNRITQFTADASHELRTPLAVMRTTTEVSLRTSQTVADYREAQQEVLAELEKTSSLVEKLMLLARADAGVAPLQHAPVNLAECLRRPYAGNAHQSCAVPETYAAGVPEGTKVDFTVPTFPGRTFSGTIARIAHSVDIKTRTMPVELEAANIKGDLSPGTFSDVLWPVRRSYPTLFVPTSSVANTLERVFVVRIRDGKSEWVDVKTGATAEKMTEVFGELHEGDVVAVRGTDELRPGTLVSAQQSSGK